MWRSLFVITVLLLSLPASADRIKIGLLLDDLRVARWQNDRDYFAARAMELGAKVYIKSANGDPQTQIAQVENMILRQVDVLVIIPSKADALSGALHKARQANIRVLSYDRLITQAPVDLYVSFDNIQVGEMQARALLEAVPRGHYQLIGGAPSDNNAKMFRQGQMNILQPAIDRGAIRIVDDDWAVGWIPDNAQQIMAATLDRHGKDIDAVVASNDGTAGGAIQSLAAHNLDGKVAVSGQDADLGALRRIVAGTQTMTVYKPIELLANTSAEAAIKLAQQKPISGSSHIDNGLAKIPAIYLTPILVTKDNIDETVIADGYHGKNQIYQ